MEILAKDFNTRKELEAKVASLTEAELEKKPIISGTTKELRRLFLSHGKTVWGILVRATDYKKPEKRNIQRVNRGEIYKSKLEEININKSEES